MVASNPKTFELTSVGIGTFHRISSKNQNQRTLILIDNIIQSPISLTNVTTQSNETITTGDEFKVGISISSSSQKISFRLMMSI